MLNNVLHMSAKSAILDCLVWNADSTDLVEIN